MTATAGGNQTRNLTANETGNFNRRERKDRRDGTDLTADDADEELGYRKLRTCNTEHRTLKAAGIGTEILTANGRE